MSGGSGSIDPIMLELFAAEVDMHLPILSEGLLALEKGRAGKKEIESMMRAAHSIKGAARIVGNDPAVRIAHTMEDCFTAAKEERITLTSDAVDVLLQGVDALQRTCAAEPDPELHEDFIQALLQRITAVREAKAPPPPATSPVRVAGANAPASPIALTAQAAPPPPPSPPPSSDAIVFPAHFDQAGAESVRRKLCDLLQRRPELIRIDFGQVDHCSVSALALLLSLAGEVKGMSASAIEARQVSPALRAVFRVVGLESAFALPD